MVEVEVRMGDGKTDGATLLSPFICLVVQRRLAGQEAGAGRGDEAAERGDGEKMRDGGRGREDPCEGCETLSPPTHVLRGLAKMVPSSRTMPTPTLLAEPSMPRASIMKVKEREKKEGQGRRGERRLCMTCVRVPECPYKGCGVEGGEGGRWRAARRAGQEVGGPVWGMEMEWRRLKVSVSVVRIGGRARVPPSGDTLSRHAPRGNALPPGLTPGAGAGPVSRSGACVAHQNPRRERKNKPSGRE